jgi:hypothetical protein
LSQTVEKLECDPLDGVVAVVLCDEEDEEYHCGGVLHPLSSLALVLTHSVPVWKKWNFVWRRDCELPLHLYGDMKEVQSSYERTLWKQKG